MISAKSNPLRRQLSKDVKTGVNETSKGLSKLAGTGVYKALSSVSSEEAEYNKLVSYFRSGLDSNQKNLFAAAQMKQGILFNINSSTMEKITARAAMLSLRSNLRSTLNPLQAANFTKINAMNKTILSKKGMINNKAAVYGSLIGGAVNSKIGRRVEGKRTWNPRSW